MSVRPHDLVDSADQDQWTEFSTLIRNELARRSQAIQGMNLDELHTFICCCRDAQAQELASRCYDQKLSRMGFQEY